MLRVLIVEDSRTQAEIIRSVVEEAGHLPILCQDLKRGIAQTIMAEKPDVVLLDLILLDEKGKPLQDGFHMCREIKRVSNNQVGVIVISSQSDEESEEWALLQGADAFLRKPFVVDDLLDAIKRVKAGCDEGK